ncbi:Gamma-glutamylcyclotransferase, AIG2-like [Parasponia andersonii]|uniref:Gamma-glutamylcyclotransferase family protein n=1 Tax=Parasponia andersonii TaxID=3476 RepID=A0A2P5CEH0_PARAD|nr:Gamma-glutamylcyclotransferase, AIG2-like [Parasponia andersonii]
MYGTLKRGFSNHPLLQDLICSGDAGFLRTYRTKLNYPFVCGPYHVLFLINCPGSSQPVLGEVYTMSNPTLAFVDELEGTTRGHYQRLPIQLHPYPFADPAHLLYPVVQSHRFWGLYQLAAADGLYSKLGPGPVADGSSLLRYLGRKW